MDKPTPSTSVRHNDAYSEAIIDSYKKWMDGDTFQQSTVEEEKVETPIGSYEKPAFDTGTIPTCDKSKEKGDDVSSKDPKANAGAPDPATALVGSMTIGQGSASGGVQQSHGAEIRDTTKLVAREEAENVEEGKKGLYANIHAKRKRGESPAKPGSKDYPAKDAFKKAARTAKEEVSFELDGALYIFEREVIEEGSMETARKNVGASTCWKGYKAAGTKKKGGKTVPNCVKESHKVKCPECKGEGCNHCDDKGYHLKEYFVSDMREYFEKVDGKMVKKHNCAKKVKYKKEEYDVIHGEHTLLEDGTVTHYDIMSEHGTIIHNVPVEELEVTVEGMHEHFVNDAKNREVFGEKLDPVGKADADIDNDGDVDKSDKYLHARRKKVTKIIAAKNRSSKK